MRRYIVVAHNTEFLQGVASLFLLFFKWFTRKMILSVIVSFFL